MKKIEENKREQSQREQLFSITEEFKTKKVEYEKELQELQELKEQISKLENEITKLEKIELENQKVESNPIKNEEGENIETEKVPNKQEIIETTEKIEVMVADAENEIEKENEEILETKLIELEPEIKKNNFGKEVLSYLKTTSKKLYNKLNRKVVKYFILPLTVATTMAMAYQSPKDWINMGENYAERHMKNGDDPNIVGINSLYNTRSSNTEKSTYDFLGENKIDYKGGYYMTSVFDLTDQTPPEFKVINDREFNSQIDSAAGITTNLFEKFSTYSGFTTKLTGHENKYGKEKGEIPVIAYNKKTRTIKAGHFKEFNEDWMVSETYEIPVNFKLNQNGTLNLMYHENALRMVPYTTNEAGKQIPFPVGVSYDKNKKTARPSECTHFGTLEGGKVIFVCGEKQIQVNGSFADMYKVYERLQNDHKNIPIHAYLLDNGAYNLPIWNNTGTITPNDIKNHMKRHRAGGTALVLINNNKISPYEYKNHYKEIQHYTKNFTIDQKTKKPIINEKSTIVLHHTGIYENPNDIIGQFQDSAFENSAHVLIMKDGTRHLFNTDDYVMAHAGKSEFHNRNAVNYFSLGIELEGASTVGQFSVAQLESLLEYLRPRIEKYHIPLENITTHKIIRNNYIKKHPGEKVLTKNDLDDKVWEQIRILIQKKIYEKNKVKLTTGAHKFVGSKAYQEGYRKTNSKKFALNQSKQVLAKYNVSSDNINKTTNWIRNYV